MSYQGIEKKPGEVLNARERINDSGMTYTVYVQPHAVITTATTIKRLVLANIINFESCDIILAVELK